jgi:hypothetical protein
MRVASDDGGSVVDLHGLELVAVAGDLDVAALKIVIF